VAVEKDSGKFHAKRKVVKMKIKDSQTGIVFHADTLDYYGTHIKATKERKIVAMVPTSRAIIILNEKELLNDAPR
jgi:hypothetical protein